MTKSNKNHADFQMLQLESCLMLAHPQALLHVGIHSSAIRLEKVLNVDILPKKVVNGRLNSPRVSFFKAARLGTISMPTDAKYIQA